MELDRTAFSQARVRRCLVQEGRVHLIVYFRARVVDVRALEHGRACAEEVAVCVEELHSIVRANKGIIGREDHRSETHKLIQGCVIDCDRVRTQRTGGDRPRRSSRCCTRDAQALAVRLHGKPFISQRHKSVWIIRREIAVLSQAFEPCGGRFPNIKEIKATIMEAEIEGGNGRAANLRCVANCDTQISHLYLPIDPGFPPTHSSYGNAQVNANNVASRYCGQSWGPV